MPFIAFDGFFHFRSSTISGSASRISARMRARASGRQSAAAAGAFGAGFRGPLARAGGLAFGFALAPGLARFIWLLLGPARGGGRSPRISTSDAKVLGARAL